MSLHHTRRALRVSLLCAAALFAACSQPQTSPSDTVHLGEDAASLASLSASTLQAGQTPHRLALPVAASDSEAAALLAANPGLQAFLRGAGQGWTVSFDRRSGQPMLLEGPGIPWLPGTGSGISPESQGADFASLSPEQQTVRLSQRGEALARALLQAHPGLFGVAEANLALDAKWTGSPDGANELLLVTFRNAPSGVQHLDARLTFVVRYGNLVQIHAERLSPALDAQPALNAKAALTKMLAAAGITREPTVLSNELKVVLLSTTAEAPGVYSGPVGKGYDAHLAYFIRLQVPGDTRTLAGYVDAKSGALLDLFDDNRYGTVTGGIFPRTSNTAEVVVPFEFISVSNGTTKTTDLGGNYSFATGTASSTIGGTYINISDTCGAPSVSTSTSPGNLSLGTSSATDCSFSTSAHSTRASRNAFYHLNHVRQMGQKWLSGVNSTATSWFGTDVVANVNLTQTCNAYWDGSSVNFFNSGSSGTTQCSNTGEISDVMQHEWGHGLDQNTKSGSVGDSAKGEAVADTVAFLMTHDQCIGPNFFASGTGGETATCPSAVRDLARVITQANISSNCSTSTSCSGALGYECHCESHILSGAHYKLAQLFVQRYGAQEGWQQFERGYLLALPNITAYLTSSAGNAYSAWMAADDDNGNVSDGTPNADIIYQAFNGQGIAGTQYPVHVATCATRPTTPTLTATAQNGSVALSWTAVSGATGYNLYRNMNNGGSAGYLPLASGLTATSYTDSQVTNGYTYNYVVVAKVSSCTSALGTPVSATPAATGSNDFSISGSPSSATVTVGGSASYTVSTATTSGSAQTVSLSVSGLPTGATASFSPTSVTSGGSSTLSVATSSTTPAGTYSLTLTGTGTSATHTTSVSLVVNSTSSCSTSSQLLANPGFESGNVSWTTTSGVISTTTTSDPSHSGSYLAFLDGYGTTHTDTVLQTITIPASACTVQLSFWLRIITQETTTTTAYDTLKVQVRNSSGTVLSTLATYSNLNASSSYSQKTFDLSTYKGQTIQIYFVGSEDSSLATDFLIDDVNVTVTQ